MSNQPEPSKLSPEELKEKNRNNLIQLLSMKPYTRLKTSIPGVFITVFASNKTHEKELAIELNPLITDNSDKRVNRAVVGYPLKPKGLFLHEVRDFDDFIVLFQKDVRNLLKLIEEVNPFKEYPDDTYKEWLPTEMFTETQRIAEEEKIQREYMCKICVQRKRVFRMRTREKKNAENAPHILIVPHDNEEEEKEA